MLQLVGLIQLTQILQMFVKHLRQYLMNRGKELTGRRHSET